MTNYNRARVIDAGGLSKERERELAVIKMLSDMIGPEDRVGRLPKWIPICDVVSMFKAYPPLMIVKAERLTDAGRDELAQAVERWENGTRSSMVVTGELASEFSVEVI